VVSNQNTTKKCFIESVRIKKYPRHKHLHTHFFSLSHTHTLTHTNTLLLSLSLSLSLSLTHTHTHTQTFVEILTVCVRRTWNDRSASGYHPLWVCLTWFVDLVLGMNTFWAVHLNIFFCLQGTFETGIGYPPASHAPAWQSTKILLTVKMT